MKYYVVKLLTNTQGQDASSVTVCTTEKAARVDYHSTLAAYYNATDVLYAIVKIENEIGNCDIMEIVDNKPTPEPEPEPINPVEEQTEE